MKKSKLNMESIPGELNSIDALQMRKARPSDILLICLILLFGLGSIWTGRMLGYYMSPSGAIQTSSMLDNLQLPRQLPDATVQKEDGTLQNLWDITHEKFIILTVYAPWCGPCQKELPVIVAQLSKKGNFIVLISKRENRDEVREQLNNLGLTDVPFYQDTTGNILLQGKVNALPATFLLTINGRVLQRQVGYSQYGLLRLIRRAKGDTEDGSIYNRIY